MDLSALPPWLTDWIKPALHLVVVLLIWWIMVRVIRVAMNKLHQRLLERADTTTESPVEARKRVDTLVKLVSQVVSIALLVTLALVVLMQVGVAVGPLLASVGVLGLAIGFGAQSLVKDIITGFFIVMENQIRVGDVAIINGTGGSVEAMTLRTVILRDLAGTVHVFPNGNISTLANMTRDWSAYVFDIGVAYKENPDDAIALIKDVGAGMKADEVYGTKILGDIEVFGVDALADSAVVIKGRIRTLPIAQWEVGREFLRRVKKQMDAAGIEIPFPHRTIYVQNSSRPPDGELEALARAKA